MTIDRRTLLTLAAAQFAIPITASPLVGTMVSEVPLSEAAALYPYRWWVSLDGGEVFQEPYNTEAEAIKAAKEHGGALVAECRQQGYDLCVDGDVIIELLYGQNEEQMGEDAEFITASDEALHELGDVVTKAIKEWAIKHKIDTTAFMFGDVRNKKFIADPEEVRAKFAAYDFSDDIRDDPLYLTKELK